MRLSLSAALIFDKLPGVKPLITCLPLLSKKLRFGIPPIVPPETKLFLAAEILIRGIEAISASSLIVFPTLLLN